jgi:chromosome partitioning protein
MGRTLDALHAAELRRAEMLAAARGSRRFRLVTVASNKGGVGKTTFAIHLAVYLRALYEDLPILVLALDDQTLIERTFAVAPADTPSIADALRAGSLERAVRVGQYGIRYVRAAAEAEALRALLAEPRSLDQLLRRSGVEGLVVVDTKSELGPPTRAAVAAADLVVAPARDLASLAEAEKVRALLPAEARHRFWVLLSGVDLRIKFEDGEAKDLLALLLAELRRRQLSHFPTFLSRSPLVEAVATAPAGPPRTVLHAAPRSLVHRQMGALVREVMDALDQVTPLGDDGAEATLPEPPAERLRDLARWLLAPRGES